MEWQSKRFAVGNVVRVLGLHESLTTINHMTESVYYHLTIAIMTFQRNICHVSFALHKRKVDFSRVSWSHNSKDSMTCLVMKRFVVQRFNSENVHLSHLKYSFKAFCGDKEKNRITLDCQDSFHIMKGFNGIQIADNLKVQFF